MFAFKYVNELVGWSEGTKREKKEFFSSWTRTMDLGVMGPARYHCAKLNAGDGS